MNFALKAGWRKTMKKLLRYNKDKEFVFIDCETFNLCLNFTHNLPWQISMIKVKGDEMIAFKDFYIKWDTHLKIGEEAARITRYSQKKMDQKGVPPEKVYPTIKDWLDNADYVVGHNILGFDIYLIKGLYEYMGDDYKPLVKKLIDTNCIARGLKTDKTYDNKSDFLEYQYKIMSKRVKGVKTNLTALGKEYNISHDYEKLHDALVDLELNLKVWNKLKWEIDL
jgi:DNA polymerase III epsilon subunit-like protein